VSPTFDFLNFHPNVDSPLPPPPSVVAGGGCIFTVPSAPTTDARDTGALCVMPCGCVFIHVAALTRSFVCAGCCPAAPTLLISLQKEVHTLLPFTEHAQCLAFSCACRSCCDTCSSCTWTWSVLNGTTTWRSLLPRTCMFSTPLDLMKVPSAILLRRNAFLGRRLRSSCRWNTARRICMSPSLPMPQHAAPAAASAYCLPRPQPCLQRAVQRCSRGQRHRTAHRNDDVARAAV